MRLVKFSASFTLSPQEIILLFDIHDIPFGKTVLMGFPIILLKWLHLFLYFLLSDCFGQSFIDVLTWAVTRRDVEEIFFFTLSIINVDRGTGICRRSLTSIRTSLFLIMHYKPLLKILLQFEHELFLGLLALHGFLEPLLFLLSYSFSFFIFFMLMDEISEVLLYILIELSQTIQEEMIQVPLLFSLL